MGNLTSVASVAIGLLLITLGDAAAQELTPNSLDGSAPPLQPQPPAISIDSPTVGARSTDRTPSASGQFLVIGLDNLQRNSIANQCEDLQRDLDSALGFYDSKPDQIVVQLRDKLMQPGRAKRHAFTDVRPIASGGMRYGLYLLIDDDYEPAEFERELIRLLLQQRMFAPHAEPKFTHMPTWLLIGAHELVRHRRTGRPSEIYKSLIQARQILTIRELMAMNPDLITDNVGKQIYRVCAAALVQSLLDQGNGSVRLRAFLEDLAVDDSGFEPVLENHFAALRQEPVSLEKWWALQMAAMSQDSGFEFLTPAETDRYLQQALIVRFPLAADKADASFAARLRNLGNRDIDDDEQLLAAASDEFETGGLQDFERIAKHPQCAEITNANREQLRQLRERAFPLYRGIITSYDSVLSRLGEGSSREVAEVLARLKAGRADLLHTMIGIEDHLNWYEATQIKPTGNEFEAYEAALKKIEELESERRRDPVSRYLDAIEKEFK